VSATAAIHNRLRSAAAAGSAILFYSSDLDEVLHLAERVVIVVRGVVTEAPFSATRADIGHLMLGSEASA
jgi:general nucleoside transport system ATP-binding protein